MVNAPQSSRVAGSMTRSMFPNVGAGVIPKPEYFAAKFFNQAGTANVQIKEKKSANILHYLIGIVAVVGVFYYMGVKLD